MPELPIIVSKGESIQADTLNKLIRYCEAITPKNTKDITYDITTQGTIAKINKDIYASRNHPFKVEISNKLGGEDNATVRVLQGGFCTNLVTLETKHYTIKSGTTYLTCTDAAGVDKPLNAIPYADTNALMILMDGSTNTFCNQLHYGKYGDAYLTANPLLWVFAIIAITDYQIVGYPYDNGGVYQLITDHIARNRTYPRGTIMPIQEAPQAGQGWVACDGVITSVGGLSVPNLNHFKPNPDDGHGFRGRFVRGGLTYSNYDAGKYEHKHDIDQSYTTVQAGYGTSALLNAGAYDEAAEEYQTDTADNAPEHIVCPYYMAI
jgi:hypothetical protein